MEYFDITNELIIEREAKKRVRERQDNRESLKTNWEIGKLIVEAQGGEKRAQYGDKLIQNWSKTFTEKYGKGYNAVNMKRFRQLYLLYPNGSTVSNLSWSHIVELLPIKNNNERNYYINMVELNRLSIRELRSLIKTDSFGRLAYKDKNNIELIDTNYHLTIGDMIKDPFIIETNKNPESLNEKEIHQEIIAMLENHFLELGFGFALIGHEYKINIDGKIYRIDLLFFNYELNAFVVVEVKVKELQPKDISQINFYTNYIDKHLKKDYHNKTIGLLIVKKYNKLVLEYCTNNDIFITSYKLLKQEVN